MRVVLSPAAEDDLEDIGDTIAQDNPRRAVTFIRDIRDRCHAIAHAPRAAPRRDDIVPGLRMRVHGTYLIFYRILEEEIRIERVLHGARDIVGLLGGEPE